MMNAPKKMLQKTVLATAISSLTIFAIGAPAMARPDPTYTVDSGTIYSNFLPMNFNVTDIVTNEIVSLTWSQPSTSAPADTADKPFHLKKNKSNTITAYVSPGQQMMEDEESRTIAVLLKISTQAAANVSSLKVGGNNTAFFEPGDGYTYYVLKAGLNIAATTVEQAIPFDIAFSSVSGSGTPFQANLVAVKEPSLQTVAGTLTGTPATVPFNTTQNVLLTYTFAEAMTNGSVTVTLPFPVSSLPQWATTMFSRFSNNMPAGMIATNSSDVSVSGNSFTIKNINALAGDNLNFPLNQIIFNIPVLQHFEVTVDADGDGTAKTPSATKSFNLTVNPPS